PGHLCPLSKYHRCLGLGSDPAARPHHHPVKGVFFLSFYLPDLSQNPRSKLPLLYPTVVRRAKGVQGRSFVGGDIAVTP
ncbi:unnamed protein product, partial [Pylaiella littoralis]